MEGGRGEVPSPLGAGVNEVMMLGSCRLHAMRPEASADLVVDEGGLRRGIVASGLGIGR